jgi:hypothetical protein
LAGLGTYALTTLPVLLGLVLADTPGVLVRDVPSPGLLTACCYFDGGHFHDILRNGYHFDPDRQSTVAFFPGYPIAAGAVRDLTDCPPPIALVLTSNAAFAAALVLLSAYLRHRDPAARPAALALVGLWPVGFYFRMAYSESLFLAALALLLLGLARRWPVVVLALVAGAATGIRAVGVAAAAAVAVHILSDTARGPVGKRLVTTALILPLCCWGLLAYMGYQHVRFGNAVAFSQTQRHWTLYTSESGGQNHKWERLAIAEPVWNVYVPGSPRHWSRIDDSPLLGLAFWNPIAFVFALACVGIGWRLGWLTRPEGVLGLGLLFIPYFTRADEMSMVSQSRFGSVVIPVYVVIGRVLSRCPPAVSWVVFAGMSPLLLLWTALFAATWPLF